MSAPAALGLRMYRFLAAAFPQEFRNVYGDQLLLTAEDSVEEIWRERGVWGLAVLLIDVALRVPAEYFAEFVRDVRYGLRSLRSSPGFTLVALVSLTLGIGVASSAFSEMNGFVLRDVPVIERPSQLVLLQETVSFPAYEAYRRRTDLFENSFAFLAPVAFGVGLGTHTERVWGNLVTPSYFATLGVRPSMGRFFAEQEPPGAAPSAIVSYRFWQIELGADPSAVGRTMRINGQACTLIGVGPKDFQGASPMFYIADLWLPASVDPSVAPELGDRVLERRDLSPFHFEARLKPGVRVGVAEAALDTVKRQIEQSYGEDDKNRKGRRLRLLQAGKMMPTSRDQNAFFAGFFSVLGGMILLIACSNVANMTLARAADRRKEIAVRLAIGASRSRLVRQLLTESMLIAVTAGGLGLAMATWLMHEASKAYMMPYVTPVIMHLEPDSRCVAFTFALTVLTGLAFGLVPALRATRTDLTPALKEGDAVRLGRYRRLNSRNLLVVAQITASLTLLLITGFLVIGHRRMTSLDVGFDPRNLYLISVDPVRDGHTGAEAADLFHRILDRMDVLPVATAATLTNHSPMEGIGYPVAAVSTAEPGPGGARVIHVARRFIVGRNYFETVGVRILSGRAFRKDDETRQFVPVIVSETLAGYLWKGENPVGRHVLMGRDALPGFSLGQSGGASPTLQAMQEFEVVGLAKNVRDGLDALEHQTYPAIYLPLRSADFARPQVHGLTLMVRARPGVDAFTAMRREIAAVDAKLTPFHSRTMTDQIQYLIFAVQVAAGTYACIGLFGLILAAVGLAGVTAYSVARRGREIGIRMAVGASRADVLRLVMREAAVLVLIGSVLGMAGAWAGMRGLSGFLAEIARIAGASTSDPMLLIGAPAFLAVLALAACYLPARKSMRIDPAITLRQE